LRAGTVSLTNIKMARNVVYSSRNSTETIERTGLGADGDRGWDLGDELPTSDYSHLSFHWA
jgi:hypothetical protein